MNNNIQPKLVDYSLFPKPKKIIPKKKIIINPSLNFKFYINLVGILLLIIGGLFLYQRLIDKDKTDLEKQNTILEFHQYVHDKTI